MTLLHVVVLAIIQGLAELLPVSSSAHVIVAEKLMGLDPSKPEMTLLLVMLHTGTMFAVIVYFWRAWRDSFFSSFEVFRQQAVQLGAATLFTLFVAGVLKLSIEKWMEVLGHKEDAEIELLFRNLGLVAAALTAVGILILISGLRERKNAGKRTIGIMDSAWIGFVQGWCIPFRGFSRSGATISVGLIRGVLKPKLEQFSFALAVILTPIADVYEILRMIEKHHEAAGAVVKWACSLPASWAWCALFWPVCSR